VARLSEAIDARRRGDAARPLIVVVDDAGELLETAAAGKLENVVRRGRDLGVRVILGIEVQTARVAYAPYIKEVRKDGHGILLDPDLDMDGDVLGIRLPRRTKPVFPAGRGYYVRGGSAQVVQIAR
jgi:S-DNA-T family DNA segregation ATPase FtsK/SpoIIIE